MILVLLGTFKIDFSRPIKAIEKAVLAGRVTDEIIIQAGHTNYKSDVLTIRKFIDSDELSGLYDSAEVVVTHAGVGSILKGFEKGKKIIAVPRLYKYHEHVDDHQLDILEEFTKENYLIPWNENDDFATLLTQAKSFVPAPFVSNKQNLTDFLIDYIEKLK
ncbi:MAG: exopolysaccharide biosynthesis protein [Pedobacter sp.]|nr:MAG: exopolysaccharide biosynthesis protein [Pedobacter sp.]